MVVETGFLHMLTDNSVAYDLLEISLPTTHIGNERGMHKIQICLSFFLMFFIGGCKMINEIAIIIPMLLKKIKSGIFIFKNNAITYRQNIMIKMHTICFKYRVLFFLS